MAETRSETRNSNEALSASSSDAESQAAFTYAGNEDGDPPEDVEHATVDDSVVRLPLQAFQNRRKLTMVKLKNGLKIIGRDCFEGCRELRGIDVPGTVVEIRSFAFAGCYNLRDLNLSEGLELIDTGAFVSCIWLRTIKIPTVRFIRSHAFAFCIRLTTLELPEGLQFVASKAFRQCISLMTVRLPSTVRILKACAFLDCKNLLSVEVAEQGLQRIESKAFQNCEDLRSFCLPSTVTEVATDVFDGCKRLKAALPEDHEAFLEALRRRFDDLPIHKLAYFHSYKAADSVIYAMATAFSQEMPKEQSPPDRDIFRMTPLHLIALSSKPNIEVALQLVRHYSEHHTMEDTWGRLPVIYLCQSAPPNSVELVQLVANFIQPAILETFHLHVWKNQMAAYIASLVEANDCRARSSQIQRVLKLVDKYRTKEKLCLIEWMLWKKKLEHRRSVRENDAMERPSKRSRKTSHSISGPLPSHRVQCRALCGADIVISNVVPFLNSCE